jgi:hypothetical protein
MAKTETTAAPADQSKATPGAEDTRNETSGAGTTGGPDDLGDDLEGAGQANPGEIDADLEASVTSEGSPDLLAIDGDPYALVECVSVAQPGVLAGTIVWPMAKDVPALVAKGQVKLVTAEAVEPATNEPGES